jgi:ribosomal protein S18 acetylase RimI-like enzyme
MANINSPGFNLNIRKAELSDAELLVKLGRQSFHEAFATQTEPQDMEVHLRTAFNINAINTELKNDHSLFIIVETETSPVGYAYLHPKIPPDCMTYADPIQLERFYLLKNYYGQGVGNALMKACLKEAKALGYRSVWLSSWELNDRANSFYKKWQFKIVGRQRFAVGNDVQNDYVFSRRL